jgi:hypothetical protein
MREHQIVVNLKVEQFEQLQKLARERGFKSVSAFVKQKVLELAMGIDSTDGQNQPSAEQVSLAAAPVLADLDRIHNELKSFLDELAGPTELPNSAIGASASLQSGSAASFNGHERDFAVAAPDDDFDWAPAGASGYSTAAYTNSLNPSTGIGTGPTLPGAAVIAGSAASSLDIGTGASDYQEESSSNTLPQVLPSSKLGGFGYGLGKYSSYSGAGSSARFSTPFNAGDRLSGYRDIMDDMEELADRAFAISPRLGAIDESVEEEPAEDSRGRRKRVESVDDSAAGITSSVGQAKAVPVAAPLDDSAELDEQGAAELEASAYEESAEDYDSGDDYGEEELKLDLELGTATASALPSFVEPIALDKLLTPEQLEAEDVQDKLNAKEEKKAQAEAQMRADLAEIAPVTDFSPGAAGESSGALSAAPGDQADIVEKATEQVAEERPRTRRRSNKLFEEPMLPPPDEIDEAVERKPTFVPPPAPLPPRVSQTNIPAMTAEEAAAMEKAAALAAAAAIEEDLLSELLDGNLTHQRDQLAPNPFAVSLSFELEATAVATNDVAGPVGMLADELVSMEEQTPLGQVAMAAEAALHEASPVAELSGPASTDAATNTSGAISSAATTSSSGSAGSVDAVSTNSGEESLNPTTFSGTPPPKRRRT